MSVCMQMMHHLGRVYRVVEVVAVEDVVKEKRSIEVVMQRKKEKKGRDVKM
jgi:hypothetical protein